MTRKHYVAIANIISIHFGDCAATEQSTQFVADLADYFASENSHFDRERFLQACGIVSEEVSR